MPVSSHEGKAFILRLLDALNGYFNFRQVLDVGAGAGGYCRFLGPAFPDSEWTALEIWQPYLELFELETHYQRVLITDARSWVPDRNFDLVIMGDVLEHMQPQEALDLVIKLLDYTQLALISIPIVHMPQGTTYGNPYERHVKDDWSHKEVLGYFPNISMSFAGEEIGVYLLSANQGVHEVVQLMTAGL